MKVPTLPKRFVLLTLALVLCVPLAWAAREFRQYAPFEGHTDDIELPRDWQTPGEFTVGRLMYAPAGGGFFRFGGGDWRQGGTSWAVDYPRGDRLFAQILRRLTRINARSVEQPVNLEDGDDVFDWPYLVVGLPGYWEFPEEHIVKLREYLLRGGFLVCDSFFGSGQWEGFVREMRRVFPDRAIEDLPASDPIFHTLFDVDPKGQVPHWNGPGRPGWLSDGQTPHWRGIRDDSGRVMVMIAFNNDLGDSFQWADDPEYPLAGATLGMHMSVNFAMYSLTH
jgi:hypothetical protein